MNDSFVEQVCDFVGNLKFDRHIGRMKILKR